MQRALALCLAACMLLGAAADAAASEDSPAQRFGCAVCHGETGISSLPQVPNLAGQNRLYLAKQLRDFISTHASSFKGLEGSERGHPAMKRASSGLTEADINELAGYYAGLACPAGRVTKLRPPPTFGRDCVRCHGPGGVSLQPAVPDLGGQKPGYLLRQMHALSAAARRHGCNDESKTFRCDPVMAGHAVTLTGDQMIELASYFSKYGCRTER